MAEGEPTFDSQTYRERDFITLLEKNTGFRARELSRLSFSLHDSTFYEVPKNEPRRSAEALWHADSATLIVAPPHDERPVTIEDLPQMALPVVGFIGKTQPDIVVGCDRGARFYAIAVYALWGRLRRIKFPTLDAKMHYARLSTSLRLEITAQALSRIITRSKIEAKAQNKKINGSRPRILFIDDLIDTGATRDQILRSLSYIGVRDEVDVNFAVMCGQFADVSGHNTWVFVPGQRTTSLIGVDYTKDGDPIVIRTKEVLEVRAKLHLSTRKFVKQMISQT